MPKRSVCPETAHAVVIARILKDFYAIIEPEVIRIRPGEFIHLVDGFTVGKRSGLPKSMLRKAPVKTGFARRVMIITADPVGPDPADVIAQCFSDLLFRIYLKIVAIDSDGLLMRIPKP